MIVNFTVPGVPVPKARARVVNIKGRSVSFTPKKTKDYELVLASIAGLAMRGRPLLTGPLVVNATFILPIPASWTKKKKESARLQRLRPTTRPDLDNLLKVIDGLEMVVFKNDSQIVEAHVVKVYGENPCAEFKVLQLNNSIC